MIEIINRQRKQTINKDRYRALLARLVDHYRLDDPEITLAFVNNKAIRELNRKFLNKNSPTDVLSFPVGEKAPDGKFYLGDIIISVPKALDQAKDREWDLEKEMEILTVHGFLHLLGYEHFKGLEKEEKKILKLMLEG
jgi:probable rRNA maturation factor